VIILDNNFGSVITYSTFQTVCKSSHVYDFTFSKG